MSEHRVYSDMAEWWPLFSSAQDYAAEAAEHWRVMSLYAERPIRTLLELGSGGGNNATHLKKHCKLTLTDVSPGMLEVSRRLNPECEHVKGDMRSLRLLDENGGQRVFEALFVHDAVMYMTSAADLQRAMQTAFAHCAAGGVALFVPDCVRETFREETSHGGHDGGGRALRYLCWSRDPDPEDTEYNVEMAFLLQEGDGAVRPEYERHTFGLFTEGQWVEFLSQCGFRPHVEPCRYPEGQAARSFVGVRPSA